MAACRTSVLFSEAKWENRSGMLLVKEEEEEEEGWVECFPFTGSLENGVIPSEENCCLFTLA